MLLHDFLARYDQAHDLQPSTLTHYHWVVRSFEQHGGSPDMNRLSGTAVNDWLAWLKAAGRSPWTIKQRRISLLVLWRAAWEDGLAPPIEPVRRLRPLRHSPTAWTRDEVLRLIAAADAAGPFWGSLVRAGYDTGLRLGDLLSIQVGQIASKLLRIDQHKTGLPVACQFRPATLDAIRHQLGARTTGLVWPWPQRREAFYRRFRRLVADAGIRPGTFRWLRRTAATQVERLEPGRGTELLGHASRATTEQFYIDRSQLGEPPLPPL